MKTVKNPIVSQRIDHFKISFKDPDTNSEINLLIVTGFTPQGYTCYAWHGYSDKIIGQAGGYGYDKTHSALAEAIHTITGADMGNAGPGGFQSVVDAAKKAKIKVTKIL